jgi:hypothetical protein
MNFKSKSRNIQYISARPKITPNNLSLMFHVVVGFKFEAR